MSASEGLVTDMADTIAEELALGGDHFSCANAVNRMFDDDGYVVVKLPKGCACGGEWPAGDRTTVFYEPEITEYHPHPISAVIPDTSSGEAQIVYFRDPEAFAIGLLAAVAAKRAAEQA